MHGHEIVVLENLNGHVGVETLKYDGIYGGLGMIVTKDERTTIK